MYEDGFGGLVCIELEGDDVYADNGDPGFGFGLTSARTARLVGSGVEVIITNSAAVVPATARRARFLNCIVAKLGVVERETVRESKSENGATRGLKRRSALLTQSTKDGKETGGAERGS